MEYSKSEEEREEEEEEEGAGIHYIVTPLAPFMVSLWKYRPA